MRQMTYRYPAVFHFDDDGISIQFPDLPGCLPCAFTEEEAFRNAKEALGLHLYGMEQDGDDIPTPSAIKTISPENGGVITLIEVYMPTIRERENQKPVNKTLTIPAWLNRCAENAGVNFSAILQSALKAYLGIESVENCAR